MLLGIFAGTFTGLAPGVHINLVGAILIGFSGFIGLLILITSTFTGIYCNSFNIRKTNRWVVC